MFMGLRYDKSDAVMNNPRSLMINNKSNGQVKTDITCDGLKKRNYIKSRPNEFCCVKFWNCLLGSSSYRRRQRRNSRHKSFNSVSQIDKTARKVLIYLDPRLLIKGKNILAFLIAGNPDSKLTGFYIGSPHIISNYDELSFRRMDIVNIILNNPCWLLSLETYFLCSFL